MPEETSLTPQNNNETSEQERLSEVVSPEVLDKLPPEVRQQVILMMSSHRYGLPTNPIAQKVTSEHIDKLLDSADKDSEREFKADESARRYNLTYYVLGLLFLGFLLIYLPQIDKQLLNEFLKALLAFIGGFGASSYINRKRKKED